MWWGGVAEECGGQVMWRGDMKGAGEGGLTSAVDVVARPHAGRRELRAKWRAVLFQTQNGWRWQDSLSPHL